ncbi:MAG: sulfur carrier protein ThiS [Proteobacteria bacterium]|nr:sulfur carrier protein ThiS [Pseudomonadota bacterium]
MEIFINGQRQSCRSCTLLELLAERALSTEALVVELNGDIIQQEQWPIVQLKDNDTLELLSFVGGG